MAGALASALVDEVVGKITSVIQEKWELLRGFEADPDSMRSKFTAIQAVLQDAESRCVMPDSFQLRDWLKKLKVAAEDVADFLDEIEAREAEQREQQLQNRSGRRARYCCSSFFNSMLPKSKYDMAHKIRERLDGIAEERRAFHLNESAVPDRRKEFEGRETIAIIDEGKIVGRDEDRENIIKLVVETDEEDEGKNVSVVPVVGIGGLGKTTLAQLVFNDSRVSGDRFDLRVWVCVSDDFSLEAIGKKILFGAKKTRDHLTTRQAIAKHVVEELKEKRFLLVLDDVWNEDQDKWDEVAVLFKAGKRGSKILVTTRSEKVAKVMGAVSKPYSVKRLSEDHCWALFKRKAFADGEERDYPSLEEIGRQQIVPKCGGVPLAVIALGGMMRHRRTNAEWEEVRDSEIWKLKDDKILPSLRLSYIQLPSGLKNCFAYCSIFPKDHRFDKEDLINQWIALGFISTGVIGSQYFNHLLSMSFLQDLWEDWWTRRFFCKMHDLVHDLAQSVAGDEFSVVEVGQAIKIPGGCRYLSLIGFRDEELPKPEIPVAVTRKLRAFHFRRSHLPWMLGEEAKCLRVLDLQGAQMTTEELGSFRGFKQLRYLDLSGNDIKELPESLSGLHYLQTLNLSYCKSLESLPDSIAGFQSLQSLNLPWCTHLTTLHESIGCLTKLRTLNLGGCDNLENLPDSLSRLQSLEYLNLARTLVVALPKDIGSLRNLQTLFLDRCERLQQLPNSIGKLQNLRTLDLACCSKLQTLPPSISDLLNLEKLDLSHCRGLTKLPQEMQKMAKLRHLLNERVGSCIPRGIGKLTNLLTLSNFKVGEQGSRDFEYATIAELQHLDHLRGNLEIYGLEKVKDPEEAMRANLEAKHKLGSLTFSWDTDRSRDDGVAEAVLQSLQPHQNLEVLRIFRYVGSKYPSWMVIGI